MRALITRPSADSEPLAERLREMGVEPILAPLVEIVPRADAIAEFDLAGVLAVLITSANGARMLARATERRDLRLFTVGDASAAAARDLGFLHVDSAGGDVSALAQLVYAALPSDGGPLVHVAGSEVAGDLSGALERAGFAVRRAVLYDQTPAAALPPAAAKALTRGTVEAALFYSPRTAATFVELVRKAGLETAAADMTAYCLSENVAAKASDLPWKTVRVAADPEQGALLDLIAADLAASPAEPPPTEEIDDATTASAARMAGDARPDDAMTLTEKPPAEKPSTEPAPAEDDEADIAAPADAEVKADAEKETAAPRRRRVLPIVLLVLAAALTGGGYLAWPWIAREAVPTVRSWLPAGVRPAPEPAAPDPLQALERRLAELESAARAVPVRAALEEAEARSRAAVAAMEARLEALRAEIADLADRPPAEAGVPAAEAARMAARIQEQQARIESQEKALATLTARLAEVESGAKAAPRGAARLLAAGQLADAVEGGRAYAAEIAALDALLAEAPNPAMSAALAVLKPNAGAGIPTRADLRARLPALARAVLAAPVRPGAPGWLEKMRMRLTRIVTVRRTADGLPAGGPGPDAEADELLALAEARMDAADLAGAIAALARLQGPRAAVAAGWLADARARQGADVALADLRRAAVAGIGEAGTGGAATEAAATGGAATGGSETDSSATGGPGGTGSAR